MSQLQDVSRGGTRPPGAFSETPEKRAATSRSTPAKSRLWWWVVVAFLIQCTAWGVWFKIAASAHVQDVPLATAEDR